MKPSLTLIDKYLNRIKTSFPEDDKLMIDLQDFANELSINGGLDETQDVRQNEDAESNFNCLGVMKGLSDNECISHCGSEHCDGY